MALFTRSDPETVDESTRRTDRAFQPWMLVAGGLGLLALVLGIWAMTKTGLDTDHMFTPRRRVFGFDHTPALALGEALLGILLILAIVSRLFGRTLTALFGAAMLGFGIVVVIDAWPHRIARWTAAGERHGWVFIAAGAVAFLAATMLPSVRQRTVTRSREVHDVARDADEPAPHRRWWEPRHEQPA